MNNTTPKPFVFVLMPFDKEFDDIYNFGIKAACSEAGAYCERADEQVYLEGIVDRIYNQISKADIIVSDMSDKNPNVFYETGYAHALGKKVILLTQKAADIPFDLKNYPHIVYEHSIMYLKEKLIQKVKWVIDNPDRSLKNVQTILNYYISGVPLDSNPTITLYSDYYYEYGKIMIRIGVYNPNSYVYSGGYNLGLRVKNNLLKLTGDQDITIDQIDLPGGEQLYLLDAYNRILPNSWTSYIFYMKAECYEYWPDQTFEANLCVYTEFGNFDFPFKLIINRESQ